MTRGALGATLAATQRLLNAPQPPFTFTHNASIPMSSEPLTPAQVDALLRPDPRTASADMLVLRDALLRLGEAWEQLAAAAGDLHVVADEIARRVARPPRADAPGEITPPQVPPRAD